MKNINMNTIEKIEKSLNKQRSKNYNLQHREGHSPADAANLKRNFQKYIDNYGPYLQSTELKSDIERIEAGLMKIKSGNYEKGTFAAFRERALNELIEKNRQTINSRMEALQKRNVEIEKKYQQEFSANPGKTQLELQQLQARIDLMSQDEAAARLQDIKNGAPYTGEIEIVALLNAAPVENFEVFKKNVADIDPAWVDHEVRANVAEIESLAEFPADMLPVRIEDGGKVAITGIPVIDMLDDVSQPGIDAIE